MRRRKVILGGISFLAATFFIYRNCKERIYRIVKRVQDVILSSFAIIVLFPFLLLVSLAIMIDDPKGGPIYRQIRIGKDGKPFYMLKFRSMHKDADKMIKHLKEANEADGPVFKIKDDPRITRIGKLLRKTSIDELPQLVNILMGDMSIVGPRPPLPEEVMQYTDEQKKRLSVVPGLTCYWQVSTDRHDMLFDEWVNLDLKYIKERSFFTDWKLIFQTMGVVLKMGGI